MRVSQILLGNTIHAHTPSLDFSWKKLVGIQIDSAQTERMEDIPLPVDLDFGAVTVETHGNTLRLSLKSAYLQLEMENASIDLASKYVERFADGSVAATEKREQTKGHEFDVGANGNADATRRGGTIRGAVGWKRKDGSEVVSEVTRRINLVTPSGQDGWWLGPEGDARMVSGDLEGQVVYWNHGETMKPLCRLRANDNSAQVTARLRVQAQISHFRVSACEAAMKDDLGHALRADKPDIVKRIKKAETELQSRVAALAMLRPNLSQADPGYFDIASRTVKFVPKGIDE